MFVLYFGSLFDWLNHCIFSSHVQTQVLEIDGQNRKAWNRLIQFLSKAYHEKL